MSDHDGGSESELSGCDDWLALPTSEVSEQPSTRSSAAGPTLLSGHAEARTPGADDSELRDEMAARTWSGDHEDAIQVHVAYRPAGSRYATQVHPFLSFNVGKSTGRSCIDQSEVCTCEGRGMPT